MPRLFRRLLPLLALLMLLSGVCASAAPAYRVGYRQIPGYFTRDKQGHYQGIFFDYLEHLSVYANCQFVYVPIDHESDDDPAVFSRQQLDMIIGVAGKADKRFLYSTHNLATPMAQISLAQGTSLSDALHLGYYAPDYPAPTVQQMLRRFFPRPDVSLVPLSSPSAFDEATEDGSINGIINDTLHPVPDFTPALNLQRLSSCLVFPNNARGREAKETFDLATDLMLATSPYLRDTLANQYAQSGLPLLLTPEEKEYLAQHRHFTAYASADQRPFSYFVDGQHRGIVHDILTQIEHDLGITIDVQQAPAEKDWMQEGFSLDDKDLYADVYQDFNYAHEEKLYLTLPYIHLNYVHVTRRGKKLPRTPIVAAVKNDGATRDYVQKNFPAESIQTYDTPAEALKAVDREAADLAIVKALTAQPLINEHSLYRLVVRPSIDYTHGFSLGVNKQASPILVRILNKEIAHLSSSTVQSIVTRQTEEKDPFSLWAIFYRYPTESLVIILTVFLLTSLLASAYIHMRQRHAQELLRMTYIEPSSGLHNLRWFKKKLPAAVESCGSDRAEGRLALLSISIKHAEYYKTNRSFNLLLKSIRQTILRLQEELSFLRIYAISDDVARFYVLLCLPAGETPENAAREIAAHASVMPVGKVLTRFAFHIGIVRIPPGGLLNAPEVEKLIAHLDAAQLTAVNRDQEILLYDDSFQKTMNYEKQLDDLLPQALIRQEFEVWYQPKYDLKTQRPVGAEALVRWRSHELGFLMPGKFIDYAEKNGFAIQLDYYMLGHVCRFQQARLRAGLPLLPVSVNQSALHITESGYLEKMKQVLQAYELPPGAIDLELTETAFVDFHTQNAREGALHLLNGLKDAGYTTSMDDFCTGYSSIAMLRSLPMDTMKIDRSILLAAENDHRSETILLNVIKLGHDLGMNMLCEGIETEAQEQLLLRHGCALGQGFLFARPMPQDDYTAFLEKHLASPEKPEEKA